MTAHILIFDLKDCKYSDKYIKNYIIIVSRAYIIGMLLGHSVDKIENGLKKWRKRNDSMDIDLG